jgi:hypothetical protein
MLHHGCLGYLQKPYNIEPLNQLVRSVLDSGLRNSFTFEFRGSTVQT